MRCHEARKFLGPYLDSELDTRTSQEIELHLEACPECARYFDAEEKLDARICNALRASRRTPSLWASIESRLEPSRRYAVPSRCRLATAAGAVTMLMAGLIAFGLWIAPIIGAPDLARAAEKHHRAYVDEGMLPDFKGPLPDADAAKLEDRLDRDAFSVMPSKERFAYVGARVCKLDGVPVAWIFGRSGDVPISVLVMRRSELAHFPTVRERIDAGAAIYCCRAGGYLMAARYAGEYAVCVIGKTTQTEVEALARSIQKHS